jgi:hypothetical protein
MRRILDYFRRNAIATLALVCSLLSLAGASYAAISLPASSVGTRQLRNSAVISKKLANNAVTSKKLADRAITAAKLDGRSIAGYVAFWARIGSDGGVLASSEPAQTSGWASGHGRIDFQAQLSSKCFAVANVSSPPLLRGNVSTVSSASIGNHADLGVFMEPAGAAQPGPLPVVIAEICP